MHQQERKELQETFFFEQFISLVPSLIHVAWRKDEAPDFLIQAGEKNIGIEIERIIKVKKGIPKHAVSADSIHEQVIDEAYKIYARTNKLPFLLFCEFTDEPIRKGKEFDFVARELATIVEREAQYIDPIADSMRKLYVNTLLSAYVKTMTIHYFSRIKRACWYAIYHNLVPDLSQEIIQDFINRKESKSFHYREKCDEVWLLLVHENISGVEYPLAPLPASDVSITTSFDKVFLLHVAENTVELL